MGQFNHATHLQILPGKSGIYAIKNTLSDKVYIGSSVNMRRRSLMHIRRLTNGVHHSKHLLSAWNKYGQHTFDFIVLELVGNKKTLISREQYWIDFYKSYDQNNGYNVSPTAGSSLGVVRSNTYKSKIRKTLTGYKQTSEHVNNVKMGLKFVNWHGGMCGKVHSLETKRKMSLAHKGKKQALNHIKNAAVSRTGLKRSQETRDKMSRSQKLRFAKRSI